MLENTKTADLVKGELENDLFLLETLKEGIINYTALARKLLSRIKKENPKTNIESISIAIKRYVIKEKKNYVSKTMKNIIADSQLSTKNDIVHMTFKRTDWISSKIGEISKRIEWDQEDIFLVNQGHGEITVIIDKKNKSLFNDCKKYLIEETNNLSLLSIKEAYSNNSENKKGIDVPGIYSYFISKLSRNSINIIEIISTLSQLTFILKNKDLLNAYKLLIESIEYFRKEI